MVVVGVGLVAFYFSRKHKAPESDSIEIETALPSIVFRHSVGILYSPEIDDNIEKVPSNSLRKVHTSKVLGLVG